jgi:hypothetical protein
MLDGVAHVRFQGGGLFLPVGGREERLLLVEEIRDRVRKEGALDVMLGHERWRVRLVNGRCSTCGHVLWAGGCSTRRNSKPCCVCCAFAPGDEPLLEGPCGPRVH